MSVEIDDGNQLSKHGELRDSHVLQIKSQELDVNMNMHEVKDDHDDHDAQDQSNHVDDGDGDDIKEAIEGVRAD